MRNSLCSQKSEGCDWRVRQSNWTRCLLIRICKQAFFGLWWCAGEKALPVGGGTRDLRFRDPASCLHACMARNPNWDFQLLLLRRRSLCLQVCQSLCLLSYLFACPFCKFYRGWGRELVQAVLREHVTAHWKADSSHMDKEY